MLLKIQWNKPERERARNRKGAKEKMNETKKRRENSKEKKDISKSSY